MEKGLLENAKSEKSEGNEDLQQSNLTEVAYRSQVTCGRVAVRKKLSVMQQ